jgi:hypothetical protein
MSETKPAAVVDARTPARKPAIPPEVTAAVAAVYAASRGGPTFIEALSY